MNIIYLNCGKYELDGKKIIAVINTTLKSFKQNKIQTMAVSRPSGHGLSPSWGHCVVFSDKTVVSLHRGTNLKKNIFNKSPGGLLERLRY